MPDQDRLFTLIINDRDEVVLLKDGERITLGGRAAACGELSRFLAEVDQSRAPGEQGD